MSHCVRIGIITDHPIFRIGIAEALSASGELAVVAHGQTAEDAFRVASDAALDILLLEIEIPGIGLETASAICLGNGRAKVVILTAVDDEMVMIDALRLGARGYILKEVTGADLRRAMKAVHRGEYYITPALAVRGLPRLLVRGETPLASAELNALTAREQQVLGFLSRGLTNREIASQLGVSVKTVKQHTTLLFAKMGVRNRVEAAAALDDACLSGPHPTRRCASARALGA